MERIQQNVERKRNKDRKNFLAQVMSVGWVDNMTWANMITM